jgi:membrane-bound metal-dependent hydrolase YbcI (DUF457 family)
MPFTPFHFGPHGTLALPLQRYIDLPVFVLANVVVDIEPLTVFVLNLHYPLHGFCHTFLVGGALGVLWGAVACPFRDRIGKAMAALGLPYSPGLLKMLYSGLLGVWLHVIFDAMLYDEMKPFYPLPGNPFLGILDLKTVYILCTLFFIPASVMYYLMTVKKRAPRQ